MKPRTIVFGAVALGVLLLVITAVIAAVTGDSVGMLTRDMRVLASDRGADLPLYAGAISTFGIMVWVAGGAIALTGALLLDVRRRWLTVFGVLLLVLALDDAYLLHESVGPSIGVPELVFYAIYAVTAGWLLWKSPRTLTDGPTFALVAGGTFLAGSIVLDRFRVDSLILEDGFKLLGLLCIATVGPLAIRASRTVSSPGESARPSVQL